LPAPFARPIRFATRFAMDEEGAVTVEAVLWIPFFFFVLMLITDTSLAFFSKAQAYRIIENGNRAFSINGDPSVTPETKRTNTQTWIENQFIAQYKRATAANVDVVTTPNSASGTVSTSLTYRARDVVAFNTLSVLGNWTITVQAQQYVEWRLP
jgi:Flp pilus assembly protein TadG